MREYIGEAPKSRQKSRRTGRPGTRNAARWFAAGSCGILLTAVMSANAFAQTRRTLKFGVLFPLSGPNAVYGQVFSKGVDLAVKEVNASHEIKMALKPTYVDSEAKPEPAVVGMNKLVHVDKVPYVLTAFSGVSKAIAPLGNRYHVIMINGGGVSPELAIGKYFLNDIPLVNVGIDALLPYVVKERHVHRVALIHTDDPFGQGVNSSLTSVCKMAGCNIVADLSINPGAASFQSEVAKIRASKPDAIYIASYGQQQNIITKQLRDGDIKATILSYSGYGVPPTLHLQEAQGALFTHQSMDFSANAMSKKFAAAYEKKYSNAPNFYIGNYANAVFILADLVKRVEKKKERVTGPHLHDALERNPTFDVLGGKLTFSERGTVTTPIQVDVIKNEKPNLVTVVKPK